MNFADTNWLEAMFFQLTDADKASRSATVERFMRKQGGQLGLSHVVYLEARNVFCASQERPSRRNGGNWSRAFMADSISTR